MTAAIIIMMAAALTYTRKVKSCIPNVDRLFVVTPLTFSFKLTERRMVWSSLALKNSPLQNMGNHIWKLWIMWTHRQYVEIQRLQHSTGSSRFEHRWRVWFCKLLWVWGFTCLLVLIFDRPGHLLLFEHVLWSFDRSPPDMAISLFA